MIPKKFNEINPKIKFYRKRIWKWYAILGRRFFSDITGGFFTVKKIWDCYEYCVGALTPDCKSHWFQHYTLEIRTDEGERLIVRKLPFDLERTFYKEYPKRRKEEK